MAISALYICTTIPKKRLIFGHTELSSNYPPTGHFTSLQGIVAEKWSSVSAVPQAAASPRIWSIAALTVGDGEVKKVRKRVQSVYTMHTQPPTSRAVAPWFGIYYD